MPEHRPLPGDLALRPAGGFGVYRPPSEQSAGPRRKRRSLVRIALIVALVLVAAQAVTLVVLHQQQAAGDHLTRFAEPDQIGRLTRVDMPTVDDSIHQLMVGSAVARQFSAVYADLDHPGRRIGVFGGLGPYGASTDAQTDLAAYFTAAHSSLPQASFTALAAANTGTVTGPAGCEQVGGLGQSETVFCGWIGPGAVLGLVFIGYSRRESDALMPVLLPSFILPRA